MQEIRDDADTAWCGQIRRRPPSPTPGRTRVRRRMHHGPIAHGFGSGRHQAQERRRCHRGRDAVREVRRASEHLRALGLTEDTTTGAPLCRWRYEDLIVDVMPIDEKVLGFSNRWYSPAIKSAETRSIAGSEVRIVTPVYFVATKLEAFHGRGGRDVTASHDLEDILTVVDGRPELVSEIGAAEPEVRAFIAGEIRTLLRAPDFVDAVPGFLLPDAASQARRALLEGRLRAIAALP